MMNYMANALRGGNISPASISSQKSRSDKGEKFKKGFININIPSSIAQETSATSRETRSQSLDSDKLNNQLYFFRKKLGASGLSIHSHSANSRRQSLDPERHRLLSNNGPCNPNNRSFDSSIFDPSHPAFYIHRDSYTSSLYSSGDFFDDFDENGNNNCKT